MKKLLGISALLLFLSSCVSVEYNADPDDQTNTPNNNEVTQCPATGGIVDSACSCTDSMSCYLSGDLFTFHTVLASHDGGDTAHILLHGTANTSMVNSDTTAHLFFSIEEYNGPGTYDAYTGPYALPEDGVIFSSNNHTFRSNNASSLYCGGGKIVITVDNSSVIKGSFYTILWEDQYLSYHMVKGGQFTARWTD